eukprot:TRINITY_DN2604_c0_g1_i1.p1 TRINITY_DN2604_c0_g1~~TRINITY_DN2604_c0_g1_i1.p1  ORF type:complete len:150 (-),score=34.56 TRINITY_DN2604_c0_g1_i1:100-549(-)
MSTTLQIPKSAVSVFAGILFGIGWIMLIDAHVYQSSVGLSPKIQAWFYAPGIVATVALFMSNIVNLEAMNPYSWIAEEGVTARVRAWLFLAFVLSFGSVAASIWIMVALFSPPETQWPGVAMILQSIFIFVSSLCFMYSKTPSDAYDEF